MFIEIEKIKYHIRIKGRGHPVICLHGFSGSVDTWRELSVPDYRLIMIDLVGHGKSDKPKSGRAYRMDVIVKHLHEIIRRLGYRKYAMLGYSMGGRIALNYTIKYRDEIDKLILESASYGISERHERLKRRMDDHRLALKIKRYGVPWFVKYWSNLSIFQSQKRLGKSVIRQIEEARMGNEAHALANTLMGSGQGVCPYLKGQIPYTDMPILYISGALDGKYCLMGAELREANPLVGHVIINGAGHNTHLEDSKAFNEAVNGFLSDGR